jgi:hypothetical protein
LKRRDIFSLPVSAAKEFRHVKRSLAVWSEETVPSGAPADAPVALDVGFESVNPRAVSPDRLFIGADHVVRCVIATVNIQPVAIALQLRLFPAKALFVGAQVRSRAGLGRRKGTDHQWYSQKQVKASAHSLDPMLSNGVLRIVTQSEKESSRISRVMSDLGTLS